MTRKHFDEQLALLKKLLTEMGGLNCDAIENAVNALERQDPALAKKTKAIETQVDEKESEVERLCLKIILKQQPVASDLLFVTSAMKMITDMERIADQAVDISDLVVKMSSLPYAEQLSEIAEMAEKDLYLKEAYEELERLSMDEEKRYAYEAREKALRDHISMMNYAMEKGLQEGRDKGYAEGRDKGYAEGREEGCDRVNRLNCLLMKDKRYEEMARAAGDREYQEKLFREYRI